jgi:hypothetical protein
MDDLSFDPRLLPVPLLGGQYHFETRAAARADAMAAIELADPSLFGAALHEIQDSYSHWGEGYRMPLGHGWHWSVVQIRNTLPGASLLSQFYSDHSESELRMQLSTIYPPGEIARVSREELVDLYLRTSSLPGDQERDRYGYDTDLYFEFTSRDSEMRNETLGWLATFAINLDACESDRILAHRVPSVSKIRAFLDAQ